MCAADLAPDNAHVLLCLVDVCDALAEIELGVLAIIDTFNLDYRSLWALYCYASINI